jgi:hypothetical protein
MGIATHILYGGSRLGNQLHIIAAVYAYAKKHGLEYIAQVDNYGYDKILTKVNYGKIDTTGFKLYKEPSHAYHEIPSPEKFGSNNILLDGYFQCFKYCDEYRAEILDLFGFANALNKGLTSIHVRRGDYVQHQAAFPLCTMNYYTKAINAMRENGYNDFLVFSDDIPWCKEKFKALSGNFYYSEGKSVFGDLYSMAACENQIISNSTFSVWAAWANQNPNKIVIAPDKLKNWYGKNTGVNTKDVYPDEWVGIRF